MVLSALGLFGWGAGCWYASGAYTPFVSKRLVYGLILTMGIGVVLALLGILYGFTCWGLLILAIVLSFSARRRRKHRPIPEREIYWPYVASVAAVAFIAWPAIVRPPTDGDTLIYHLPLAASWVHAHSFWNTDTQYWWYPGGSEMVGAVLITACGMFAVPFVGAIALLTLAITVYEATLAVCRNRFFAAACALALTTSHVAAIQGGDLQNDVFLATLVLALTFQRLRRSVSWPIAIALAITKPIGWVYSLATSTFTGNKRLASGLIAAAAISLWWLRNAVLIRSAIDPIPSRPDPKLFTTSIVAHGIHGFATLGQSALQDGWSTLLFVLVAFGSIMGARTSGYARMAFAAAVLWVASPYTFESGGIAQLAIGSALRFGLPAMALATVGLAQFTRLVEGRLPGTLRFAAWFLAALSLANLYRYDGIYRFDHGTDFMPWVAVIAIAAGLCILTVRNLPRAGKIAVAMAATVSLLILGARDRERANVDGYYSAILGEQHASASLPVMLQRTRSTTVATYGFASGIAAAVRPDARIIEMPDGLDACGFAASVDGVVFIHTEGRPTVARRCASEHPNPQDFEIRAAIH